VRSIISLPRTADGRQGNERREPRMVRRLPRDRDAEVIPKSGLAVGCDGH
jgi:hypothetical protein